jgi:hypothetical protein
VLADEGTLQLPLPDGSFDTRRWPLVRIMPNRRPVPLELFREQIQRARAVFERRQPFGFLIDVRTVPVLPPTHRKALAEQMKADNDAQPGVLRAFAVVVASAGQAGMMTAVLWLWPTPFPVRLFADLATAEAWLRRCIDSADDA